MAYGAGVSSHPDQNIRTPSTTFEWRRVKVAQRPKGTRKATPKASPLAPRKLSDGPLTLTVTYRGGAEDWWLVQARGRRWVVPGHRQLTDVMLDIARGENFRTD